MEYVGHHQAHAASSFYFSGFKDAAVFTVDGVGEWDTTSFGRGNGNELEILEMVEFPHSLGLLYSTFTGYLGFEVNEGEYKVMGLAPYGQPRHVDMIRKLIINQPGGQYLLDLNLLRLQVVQPILNWFLCALAAGRASRVLPSHCEKNDLSLRV